MNSTQRLVDWDLIDSVLLDMDGTLLDLHFDNHFWLEHVPQRYGELRGISKEAAKDELIPRYKDIEGTLNWYCIDHWSRELGLDIILLKQEVEHLIAVHPHVLGFLDLLAKLGKRRVLVTNAHQKTLGLKLERTRLGGHFERIISSHDIGVSKETPDFWPRLRAVEPFAPQRTLLVDDNLQVLEAARNFGLGWLLAVREPDSKRPPRTVTDFPSIGNFSELLP